MPALTLFNRRWLLAADDVPAPATILASFHGVWVVLLVVWLIEIQGPEGCSGVGPYYWAVGGLLAAFATSFAVEAASVWVGLQGGPFETRKRAAMPALIYTDMLCTLAQVGFNAYATHLVVTDPPDCATAAGEPWDPVDVMQGVVWSTWIVVLGLLALVIVSYNLFPDYRSPQTWERRFSCMAMGMCCMRRMGPRGAAKRLGNLFATMFGHIDWTPTDILVSFGLALNLQRMRRTRLELLRTSVSGGRRPHTSLTMGGAVETARAAGWDTSPGSEDGLLDGAERGLAAPAVLEMAAGSAKVSPSSSPLSAGAAGAVPSQAAPSSISGELRSAGGDNLPHSRSDLGLVDADSLQEAAYYMTYAFAAYGWLLLVWQKHAMGCMQLCCGRACGLWSGVADRGPNSLQLNLPNANKEAILQAAGLENGDLIHVRQPGEAQDVLPYFVAVDHSKKAVVLAIRGSLSLDDVVRDLLFEPSDLDLWLKGGRTWEDPLPPLRPAGPATRFAAHAGILEAARATLLDLREHGCLDDLLRGPTPLYPDYKLVVCGHSLGGGCAYLASLYLRRFFPTLRCFAFSPPGGLATAELCAGAVPWCTSAVCGQEWIPRLTVATFERMRDEMVYASVRCRRPKLGVLTGWLRGWAWNEAEMFYSPEDLPPEPREWLEKYQKSLQGTAAARATMESATKFGPPGRVMYLKPTGVEVSAGAWWRRKTKVRQYKAVWLDAGRLVDDGIVISGRMMSDHFPDYCLMVFRRLSEAASHRLDTARIGDKSGREVMEDVAVGVGVGEGAEADRTGVTPPRPGRRA